MSAQGLTVECNRCKKENVFEQPYAYHAGFENQGFLYNEAGNLTLVWSTYDPAFSELLPAGSPWDFDAPMQKKIEDALPVSSKGDHWRFTNSPRCQHCGEIIGKPIGRSIYCFIYPGSVLTDCNGEHRFGEYLEKAHSETPQNIS